jgi:hypothetical protein
MTKRLFFRVHPHLSVPTFPKKMYFCRLKVVTEFHYGIPITKFPRGKQVRILYSTRCCKFHHEERLSATVGRREGAVPETSQKTCHVVLLSLREVGGCKGGFFKPLRSLFYPEHYVKP